MLCLGCTAMHCRPTSACMPANAYTMCITEYNIISLLLQVCSYMTCIVEMGEGFTYYIHYTLLQKRLPMGCFPFFRSIWTTTGSLWTQTLGGLVTKMDHSDPPKYPWMSKGRFWQPNVNSFLRRKRKTSEGGTRSKNVSKPKRLHHRGQPVFGIKLAQAIVFRLSAFQFKLQTVKFVLQVITVSEVLSRMTDESPWIIMNQHESSWIITAIIQDAKCAAIFIKAFYLQTSACRFSFPAAAAECQKISLCEIGA